MRNVGLLNVAKVMVKLRMVEKQGWGKVEIEMRVRVKLTKF